MGTSLGNRLVSTVAAKGSLQPGLSLAGGRPASHCARDPPGWGQRHRRSTDRPAEGRRAKQPERPSCPWPQTVRGDASTSPLTSAGLAES